LFTLHSPCHGTLGHRTISHCPSMVPCLPTYCMFSGTMLRRLRSRRRTSHWYHFHSLLRCHACSPLHSGDTGTLSQASYASASCMLHTPPHCVPTWFRTTDSGDTGTLSQVQTPCNTEPLEPTPRSFTPRLLASFWRPVVPSGPLVPAACGAVAGSAGGRLALFGAGVAAALARRFPSSFLSL
jgi:hypothetical protein